MNIFLILFVILTYILIICLGNKFFKTKSIKNKELFKLGGDITADELLKIGLEEAAISVPIEYHSNFITFKELVSVNLGDYSNTYYLNYKKNQYKKNYMNFVKNQGTICGSCYAFATITIIETLLKINGSLDINKQLSTEQILDCTSSDPPTQQRPSNGCKGGTINQIISSYFNKPQKIYYEDCYEYKYLDNNDFNYILNYEKCLSMNEQTDTSKFIVTPIMTIIDEEHMIFV